MSLIFSYCLKVRYPEVDRMGVVYHGHYIPWLELARTDVIAQYGLSYREMEDRGIFVPVTELTVVYKQPAHLDDTIVILTRPKDLNKLRFSFEYQVRKAEFPVSQGGQTLSLTQREAIERNTELLMTGTTRHVCINREGKIIRLDREAPEILDILSRIQGDFDHGTARMENK